MWRHVTLPLLAPGLSANLRKGASVVPLLQCPEELLRQVALNGLCVDGLTVTDGNCGVDAFVRGLVDQAAVWQPESGSGLASLQPRSTGTTCEGRSCHLASREPWR